MTMTRELQPLLTPIGRAKTATNLSRHLETILTSPDLTAVVMFCAIGLLITAAVILYVPDLGAMTEQFLQYP
jgi:hypothetical protein